MPELQEVCLSCCETALGEPNLTDDVLTIAAGFLSAGARSVISTLWAVDQMATAIFWEFYYEYRQEGDRPTAVQQAQRSLRNLPGTELESGRFQPLADDYDAELERQFDRALKKKDQEEKRKIDRIQENLKALKRSAAPFASPFFWAAFTCQGLR
jgi:CHAT domain-containing protein